MFKVVTCKTKSIQLCELATVATYIKNLICNIHEGVYATSNPPFPFSYHECVTSLSESSY